MAESIHGLQDEDYVRAYDLGVSLAQLSKAVRSLSHEDVQALMSDLHSLQLDDALAIEGMTDAIARTVGKAT